MLPAPYPRARRVRRRVILYGFCSCDYGRLVDLDELDNLEPSLQQTRDNAV